VGPTTQVLQMSTGICVSHRVRVCACDLFGFTKVYNG